MAASDSDQYQNITKELYTKNVDLVNANKVLELIQELYEIMISSYSIESVSYRFINMIIEKMGFSDGIVVVRNMQNKHLEISGISQTQLNQTIMDMTGIATVNFKYDIENNSNILVDVYKSGQSKSTHALHDVWTPFAKQSDLEGISQALGNQLILVYPILYGDEVLGSFALIAGNRSNVTDFEKRALDKIVTVFGIAMDRVKINEELQQAHERELSKAREVINLKDQFVFIATHDLRTPVTAIKGFSELLQPVVQRLLPPDSLEDFEAISESAERLDQLIEDLLEVARSESGKIYLKVQPVSLRGTVERAAKEVETPAQKQQVAINVTIPDSDLTVLADPEKLVEIFENLLSNAVKYNKQGGHVDFVARKLDKLIEISISDTGIGIPEKLQKQVFEKFFRARQPGTEAISGTGLGLFVVRMLVEKMKGSISFSSEEGKGTTFTLKLPIAE